MPDSHEPKKKYFVVPQTREILEERDQHTFEFEIEATPEEISRLQEWLTVMDANDFETFVNGHFWLIEETHQDNEQYDHALQNVYGMIYDLGTPETKRKMEEMGLIR